MKTFILKLIYLASLLGAINGQAYPEISFISKEKGKIPWVLESSMIENLKFIQVLNDLDAEFLSISQRQNLLAAR